MAEEVQNEISLISSWRSSSVKNLNTCECFFFTLLGIAAKTAANGA
jgi:hypothetical protein